MHYTLRSRQTLKWVMDYPGRGTPYSVRTLAEVVGLPHHSKIGHLLTGRHNTCESWLAHRISEAVGVAVLVLFAPPSSPDPTESTTDQERTP